MNGLQDAFASALEVEPPPDNDARPAERKSTSTQLVELALDRYRLGVSMTGEPFAVPLAGVKVARLLRGGSGSLRVQLAAEFYAMHGKVAAQQALADALMALEGQALACDAEPLHLRSAVAQGAVWLDLGDAEGRAVRIAPTGWQVVTEAPVLFVRTTLTGVLPRPVRDVDLDELWAALNVAVPARPMVLAWLLAALLTPGEPCPVLALTGEQGTAKSTTSRRLASLVDPAEPQVRRAPKDADGWVAAATGSRVVALDNVSSVPDWLSDALCRAVTGDGDVRRRLYSDGDHHVVAFKRAVIVNGIDLGATRDDLSERMVLVELSRIDEAHRQPEKTLAAAWATAHPRLLGALLDLAVQVLAVRDDTAPERLPRMADYAVTLAAVDHVLGTAGLDRYRAQAGELAADAVSSDPLLTAIIAQVSRPWNGAAGGLLELLDAGERPPKEWPKNARVLTTVLRRNAPLLRRLGWSVEDLGRGGRSNLTRWSIVPPGASPDAGDAGDDAGDAGDSTPDAGDAGGRRPHPTPVLTCEDTESVPDAGDAGDNRAHLLLDHREEEKGHPTMRETPETSPASPARPHAVQDGPPAATDTARPRSLGLARLPGRCPDCERHVQSQGHRADCPVRAAS